jgi:hypothetical protein
VYNILFEFGVPMKVVWVIKMCLNETYSKTHVDKQEGLKNQKGVELNGTYQFPVYTNCVNLLDKFLNILNENEKALLDARKEVYLEVNAEKTKYILCLITRMQHNHNLKTSNNSFKML